MKGASLSHRERTAFLLGAIAILVAPWAVLLLLLFPR